jgi:hypothetical protein
VWQVWGVGPFRASGGEIVKAKEQITLDCPTLDKYIYSHLSTLDLHSTLHIFLSFLIAYHSCIVVTMSTRAVRILLPLLKVLSMTHTDMLVPKKMGSR